MAPEIMISHKQEKYSVKADMYSLGSTILKMIVCCDALPFSKQLQLLEILKNKQKCLETLKKFNVNAEVIGVIENLVSMKP